MPRHRLRKGDVVVVTTDFKPHLYGRLGEILSIGWVGRAVRVRIAKTVAWWMAPYEVQYLGSNVKEN